jgi:hypothetical protein
MISGASMASPPPLVVVVVVVVVANSLRLKRFDD